MKQRFLALAFLSVLAGAQVHVQSNSPVRANPYGIYTKGGLNFVNISTAKDGSYNKANTLTIFNAGGTGDVPMEDRTWY